MDFLTPYNILRHANAAFYENLHSTKWNERKEAIGELVDLMDKNPRLANDDPAGLHQLVSELTKILKADSNINVAAAAAAALARLARGLGGGFRPFAASVLTTALMRLKEVKPVLRDPCVECLDACYASTTFDAVLPPIKEGIGEQGARRQSADLRAGLPLIRTVADDKQKMAKVDAFFEEFAKEVPKEETTTTTTETPTETPKSEEAAGPQSEKKLTELGKLRAEIAGYDRRSGSERKDAMGNLVAIMEKNPRLVANEVAYHQLIDECTKILKADSNINVAGTAAQTLERLARGLGAAFRPAAPSTIAACLLRLKEVKAALRDPCVKCLDAAYLTTNLEAVLPAIKDGVLSKAPASKIQSCEFFTRIMVDVDYATAKQSAAGVKTVVDELCKLALGSDANCREAAMKSLAAFLRAVGKEAGSPLLSTVAEDPLKMAKINAFFEQFIADFPADHTAKPTVREKEASAPT
ncbi:HEAT repeat protein [Aphelenchoides fujianensis]|nr:HEAT repeat protein [Aphelenchoides fujianensis]